MKSERDDIRDREQVRLNAIRVAIKEARKRHEYEDVLPLVEESNKVEVSEEDREILNSVKFTQEEDKFLLAQYLGAIGSYPQSLLSLIPGDFPTKAGDLEKEKRHCEVVKYLVSKGINIHTPMNSPEGWSPLSYAAQYGRHLIVEYLVKEGAEIDRQNAEALRAAVFTNYPKVVQILIENGAELPDGDYIANVVRNGSIKIVKPFYIASSTEVVFNKTATENEIVFENDKSKTIFVKRLINLIYQSDAEVNSYKDLLTEETFANVSQAITIIRGIAALEDAIRGGVEDIYVGSLYDLLKDPAKLTELKQTDEELFIKTLNYYSDKYPPLQNCLSKILNGEQLNPEEENNFMRTIKQVVRTIKSYLKEIPQEKINELVIESPELTSAVKGFLAIKAANEGESESKLSDPLINKLKLALDYYNEVSELLEVHILGEMEGIIVEPLHKLLEGYSQEDYTQLTQGSVFRKTLEYYFDHYQDLREGLAKILIGNLLTTEERTELITTAKKAIKLGDYIQDIEPKTLALHMRQNSDIYKLVGKLSVLKLTQELEKQLNKAIEIYNFIDEIDNDQELAEILGIELSKIPPVKIIEDNATKEDKPMAEWFEEQFINNKNSQEQDNAGDKNDDELELEAKEKGIPDLVPEDDFSFQAEVIPDVVNADYFVAPIGEIPFAHDAG